MLRIYFFLTCLVFALMVYGCSTEINQTPAAGPALPSTQNTAQASAKLPVTWANLGLIGKLVYTAANNTTGVVGVQSLDLKTGDLSTIFEAPHGAWADAVSASPDSKTLILAYSPPMQAIYGGQESLYTMPMQASAMPEILIIPPSGQDQFSQPVWSPDGKYVYCAHINNQSMTTFEIMRSVYPNGDLEKIVDHAYWPRVSDDSAQLVYVALDPKTGANSLFIANADGTNAKKVVIQGLPVPMVIDSPMFSPDKQSILFASPLGLKSSVPNWMDRLFDVTVAHADGSLPSDWWTVPVSGGTATQLTHTQSLALYGVFSPDKKYIASYSTDGIFVMKPDGSDLTKVVQDVGQISGTVSWIP